MSKKSVTLNLAPGGTMGLTMLFVVLKALGLIDWSWWWVFCPLWAGIAIFVTIAVVGLVIAGIGLLILVIACLWEKWRER